MSALNLPPCPSSLKQIQHYLKTASEHDSRDVVVAYWCRLYALQMALKLDKSSPEAKRLLVALMDWLEKIKNEQKENEAIVHDIPAQAHLENYALKIFIWADSQDRAAVFNKNVVKAFYTAGMIYDVLDTFGETTEEVQQNKKYAKWKAAYIHNCLKSGETPVPGPMADDSENLDAPTSSGTSSSKPTSTEGFGMPPSGLPYPVPGGNGMGSMGFPMPPKPSEPVKPNPEPQPRQQPETKPEPLSPAEILDFTNPAAVDSLSSKTSGSGIQLSPDQINKAQKYCKWAASALNYDDIVTAVTNLQKALTLLTTGKDQ